MPHDLESKAMADWSALSAALPRPGSADRPQPILAERPIFVAGHNRRQRAVGAAVTLVGTLFSIWLAAIVAGALGFGHLPALPLVGQGKATSTPTAGSAPQSGRAQRELAVRKPRSSAPPRSGGRSAGEPAPIAAVATKPAPRVGRDSAGIEPSGGGPSSPSRRGTPSPRESGGGAGSPPSGVSGSEPTASGGAVQPAVTGGGSGGASSSRASGAHGPPAVTPSGNEVPSGSASGEGGAASAGEGASGAGQRKTTTSG
jgi:hypothetical protein